jgi:hypothetical protein
MYSNQPERAIEACKQYGLFGAGEANTFDTMGDCYWLAGRFDEAASQFQLAMEADPTGAPAEYMPRWARYVS